MFKKQIKEKPENQQVTNSSGSNSSTGAVVLKTSPTIKRLQNEKLLPLIDGTIITKPKPKT